MSQFYALMSDNTVKHISLKEEIVTEIEKTVRSTLHSHLFCTFVFQKIVNAKYDDSGRTFQKTGSPLQGVRLHLSFQRNIRRTGCRVRLRAERRRVEEQYQALLVGFDGASS